MKKPLQNFRQRLGNLKGYHKLILTIIIVLILAFGLMFTSLAVMAPNASVKENTFETGTIAINLNDGKSIITEEEFLFEPGMTVTKPFFLENNGGWSVYYKLYFTEVKGDLADVLQITIAEDSGDGKTPGRVLYQGTMTELTDKNVIDWADDVLEVDKKRDFLMTFHHPENSQNGDQGKSVEFALSAEAVQTKNNEKTTSQVASTMEDTTSQVA